MGAIVDGDPPVIVRNEDVVRLAGVDEHGFAAVRDRELAEITRRRRLYLGGRDRISVKDRVAIVIDDGIATGATTRAALRAIRMRQPKKLILAVPVGPALIRSRRCKTKPMRFYASKSTRISPQSAISMMISGKPRMRR